MRTFGICASILAISNIVAISSPAFAQDTAAPSTSDDKPSSTAPSKPASTETPASDETMVDVHIDSPSPVSLERRAAGSQTWEHVCTSACDVKTPTLAEYRVVGSELNPSKPFMIDGSKGKVTLHVAPGSKSKADAGLWILVAGGVVLIAGVAVLLVGADKHGVFTSDGQTHNSHLNAMFFGGALVLTGVTVGIFGAGWMLGNRQTDVGGDVSKTIDEKKTPGHSGPSGDSPVDVKLQSSLRQPTWNTPKNPGLPQFVSVPVFAGRF